MEIQRTLSRRKRLLILLLALFINVGILLFFSLEIKHTPFKLELTKEQREQLLDLQKFNQDKQPWAALKPRASTFGAPVLFKDIPEPPVEKEPSQEQPQIEPQTEEPKPQQDNQQIKKEETIDEQAVEKEETPIDEQRKEAPTQPIIKQPIDPIVDSPTQIAPEQLKEATKKEPLDEKKIAKIKEDIVAHIKQLQSKPITHNHQQQVKAAKTVTLADITRGFLEQYNNEGNNSIKTLGDENAVPTAEQLKQEMYLQKIQWCIQNSFKIHQREIEIKPDVQTTVELYLAINKDGSLKELHVAKSSGIAQLDRFMLFAFKDASSGFPPLPSFIKKDPFQIMYIVEVNKFMPSMIRRY